MNRIALFSALLLALSLPLAAEGAGGFEFTQIVGKDLWPLPGGAGLPSETGTISSAGLIGYGVNEEGSVMGGFIMAVSSENLSLNDSPIGDPAKGFHAGYLGTVQGWQHRWGPLVGLFTTRIGFGGADWSKSADPYDFSPSSHVSGFSLLGTAGAQMGLNILPWFTVGVEAGVAGTLTIVPGRHFVAGYAPTIALRLLWGAF